MSYSTELKKDLLTTLPENKDVILGELAGILISVSRVKIINKEIAFDVKTESAVLARYLFRLVQKVFNEKPHISIERSSRFHKHRKYVISFTGHLAEKVLKKTGVLRKSKNGYFSPIVGTIYYEKESVRRAFLKGIFIACGSIVNPEKSYHLEIDAPNTALTETCAEMLEDYNIEAGFMQKKNKSILYLKDSQAISDFLALIGASKAVLSLEDVKIYKQMREVVNRKVNCETANMKKSAKAIDEQLTAIEKLRESGKLEKLSAELKAAAKLREENPDAAIGELARMAFPVSRSTLYRRLKRLVQLSEELEEE